MHQTIRPYKVVLWLAEEQFRNVNIPQKLKDLCEFGLEIRYCKEDILAHKKYYYSMLEFPNHIVVTYDDDLIYPEDSLEKLLVSYEKNPGCIICNRGREILINENKIQSYDKWILRGRISKGTPSYKIMASTGAGTLYPPDCMPQETFDLLKIRELALTADDLWMKAMSIYGNIPVVKSQDCCKALCLSVPEQKVSLAQTNVLEKKNDEIFKKLLSAYPEVEERLIKDNRI
ncbi:MAG: hypothetical protein SOW34_13285 [Oliverpabstia sp.]|nr:hypothetical protein [Oliverpabstia sp.]